VAELPCIACGVTPAGDAHHWVSRGAGGHDTADNLMPLCRTHHTECHTIGKVTFYEKYQSVKYWLERACQI
jgi:hypothetical protein